MLIQKELQFSWPPPTHEVQSKQFKHTLNIEPHLKTYKIDMNKNRKAIQTNAIKYLRHIVLTKDKYKINMHLPEDMLQN